jgi:hypothetical protein
MRKMVLMSEEGWRSLNAIVSHHIVGDSRRVRGSDISEMLRGGSWRIRARGESTDILLLADSSSNLTQNSSMSARMHDDDLGTC